MLTERFSDPTLALEIGKGLDKALNLEGPKLRATVVEDPLLRADLHEPLAAEVTSRLFQLFASQPHGVREWGKGILHSGFLRSVIILPLFE